MSGPDKATLGTAYSIATPVGGHPTCATSIFPSLGGLSGGLSPAWDGERGHEDQPGPAWEPPSIVFRQRRPGEGYPPSYELGGISRQPLREVVVRQGLLGDVIVAEEEAVQGPEVMQEAHQGAQDRGSQEEEADEDGTGHVGQPQPLERRQGQQGDRDDLERDEHQQPDAAGEDAALPWLAVSQVGHRQPVEVIEAVI